MVGERQFPPPSTRPWHSASPLTLLREPERSVRCHVSAVARSVTLPLPLSRNRWESAESLDRPPRTQRWWLLLAASKLPNAPLEKSICHA